MRVVFAGTPEVARTALAAIVDSGHEVIAVVTRPDAPRGRGRRVNPSPVAALAEQLQVPILQPLHAGHPDFEAAIRALRPDCCPVVAYGSLLPAPILGIPVLGWVNLHFSLLPAWRGAAPVQRAILAGDEITGACVFRIGPGMDDGPLYGSVTQVVSPQDTSGSVLDRLAESGSRLLVATLDALAAGTAVTVPQPSVGVTYAPKVTVEDARVRWTEPLVGVDRRIRAMTPAPGAWSELGDDRVRILPLRHEPGPAPDDLPPGLMRLVGQQVWVGTATQPAALGDVRAPGRRQMPAADWVRGLRGDRLVLT